MPHEFVAQIAAGMVLGFFLLFAAIVLLLLVRSRRAPEEARSDGSPTGPVMAVAGPVDQRPATFPHGGPAPDEIGPADVPAGRTMAPLDRWDVLAVVLILVMALAAAPGGEAIAFLLLVAVLLDSRFRIWVLLRDR